eukprot:CAMPEP_0171719212 /NCGR_PEP_ID=MMETSP0991-20121206/21059_1 /TAXON_ID=483369 /ORGANISM="non described non described, Strain CCMP2098" /LENGTH=324 /DNA_ID=CAMNT_0012310707 /DNA_START=199 /DNA_END=1174 /DNA_ORIENTATION=+
MGEATGPSKGNYPPVSGPQDDSSASSVANAFLFPWSDEPTRLVAPRFFLFFFSRRLLFESPNAVKDNNVGSEQIDNSIRTDEASSSTKLEPFPWLRELQKPENVQNIKKEYLSLIEAGIGSDYSTKDASRPSGEHKMHNGDWSWHTLISKGELQPSFQESCPETTRLLTEVVGPELMSGSYLPFSFAFFSTLHARSSIAPHCAPCNLRLRVHLPLVTPSATAAERATAAADASKNCAELEEGEQQQQEEHECGMRVGNSVVPWKYGEALIFDDAFEHEVWNHTDSDRVVLLFDVWHPDITFAERLAVLEMFEGMKKSSTSSPQS